MGGAWAVRHVDWLADNLEGAEIGMINVGCDTQMLDLRLGESGVDGVDLAAANTLGTMRMADQEAQYGSIEESVTEHEQVDGSACVSCFRA